MKRLSSVEMRAPRGDAPEEREDPLARIHRAFDALPQEMHEHGRQELLDEPVKLEQAQLEPGHVGRVVRAQVVRLHQAHEHAERFFVRHLQCCQLARARWEQRGECADGR